MRTRAMRRTNAAWVDFAKGLGLAIAVTGGLVALLALLISLFEFSDGVIRAANQAIKLAAIGVGVCVAAPKGSGRALLRGAALGAVYMALGVMAYALLSAQPLTAPAYAADICLGTAFGALIGLTRKG